MVDITNKISTLRVAKAQATVSVSKQETIDAIEQIYEDIRSEEE